ncbi:MULTISPECIES: COG2426 family protein [Croceitalea]|uniref:Small multi-drug export protein n=1 Tax=Croceitalea vernalis TaxID=3075599 RepID=A0ABU3BDP4_9FLAO|nr:MULTISPECIES: small multi-drug export protein [unclassified Croceitalea]MDT0538550.1 small multi-drug export protein [Croceitalea sp. P059]MDT0620330.1 small multi-drug export protein [Croceitalea sp. P007]
MILELITAILWSISPFGESKVGIPYGIAQGVNSYLVFITCFLANLLVFPIMMYFLDNINKGLVRWRPYKKVALWVAKRAKTGTGDKIQRFGVLGLALFVMIPLPGTGVYAGSIASYLFRIERKKAFIANAIGIFFSSIIIWALTVSVKSM